jgi:hypothetical protein
MQYSGPRESSRKGRGCPKLRRRKQEVNVAFLCLSLVMPIRVLRSISHDTTSHSTPIAHMAATSFFDLPAELRIHIYDSVLRSLDGAPTSASLKDYRGFLLSCSQVHTELEAEGLKVTNAFLAQVQSAWTATAAPLKLPLLTKLSDTVTLLIGVPRTYMRVKPLIDSLVNKLPSFCLFIWDSTDYHDTYRFAFYARYHSEENSARRHYELDTDNTVILYDVNWRKDVWGSRGVFNLVWEMRRAQQEELTHLRVV